MKRVFTGLAILGLCYLALLVLMFVTQRRLQYHPSHDGLTPADQGLSGVQVVALTAADGTVLDAWYAPPPPGRPVILFFHGNGGEIAGRPQRFGYYQSQGYGVLFLSYRGFGRSQGSPSEAGLLQDAEAAYHWLTATQRTPPRDILLVGESLGSGVAVQLAARRPVGAVALEAPFGAAVDIGAGRYWWLPVRLLMQDQFRSVEHIARISAPLLIQHGTDDAIIPFAQGEALFAAANEPKQFITWPATDHVGLFSEDTWATEHGFFDRVRPPALPQ